MKLRSKIKVAKQDTAKGIQKIDESLISKKKKSKEPSGKNSRKKKVSLSQNQPKRGLFDNLPVRLSKKRSHGKKKKGELSLNEEEKVSQREWKHETDAAKLTKWIDVTILELSEILKEERKHHKDVEEEEICAICRCELYDDIFKLSRKEIKEINDKQLEDPGSINVVKFKNCVNHFYHKEWTDYMVQYSEEESQGGGLFSQKKVEKKPQYLKCSVCSLIYGEFIGDSPPGTMTWEYHAKDQCPCEGHEDTGTYAINYSFWDGVRKGVQYRGTRRVAYIPDTKEGREVVFLLLKSFQRRVTFTVGDSVTTGRKNVVVWNSIHHKTNTHGGTLTFGYPDPTYFNRVKLEMADKGVFLEEGDDPEKIEKKGTLHLK